MRWLPRRWRNVLDANGITPLRSLLFMPGDNARAHEKAATLPCDAIIFDLEDAVAEADKAAARQQIAASLDTHDYGHRILLLRINHPAGPHAREDLMALARHPKLHGIVLPKVENAGMVQSVAAWLDGNGCAASLRLLANIETPLGILNAQSIAQASPRLVAFVAGKNDLTAALRLPEETARAGLHHALAQMVLVARAYGLLAFDGVFNVPDDEMGLAGECAEGRVLGFDGKTLIHPKQIDIANTLFSPNADEVERARATIADWQAQDKGVTTSGGAMIEELHVASARRIVALHEAIARVS